MLCGNRSVALRVSRFLELPGPRKEVRVRVVGGTRHLPDRVQVRGRTTARVTRLDQVVDVVGLVVVHLESFGAAGTTE